MNTNPDEMPPVTVPDAFTPIRRNRWIISQDYEFATWRADFPEEWRTDPWKIWPFLKGFLQAGEEEKVYRVRRTPETAYGGPYPKPGQSYIDFLEEHLAETGELLFAEQLCYMNSTTQCVLTQLAYYESDGTIVEKEVPIGMLDQLLRRLRPDIPKIDSWIGFAQAIELYGGDDDLSIQLHSDIWRPHIAGFMEDYERQGWAIGTDLNGDPIVHQEGEMYDNRELALRHTPRLNRFVQRVKQLTLDYGGKWTAEGCDDPNNGTWNEDGIVLDKLYHTLIN
jgi:hypothetical protein